MSKEEYSMHILKKVVVDGFMFLGLGLIMVAMDFYWEPFGRGFFCGDESLMFPYKQDTVSPTVLKMVGMGLPVITILICEWALLRHSGTGPRILGLRVPIWAQGVYCAWVSFFLGFCFEEITGCIAKNVIGRPRPHFFDLCKPSIDCTEPEWRDRYVDSTDYYCTNTQMSSWFKDMRRSFLSGHSALSAYSMLFLAFYLERRMTWGGTRVLRHGLQFLVLMLSWFCALSRVSDFKHHWSDVLAGYTMGVAVAILTWKYCTELIPKKQNVPMMVHEIPVAPSIGHQMA